MRVFLALSPSQQYVDCGIGHVEAFMITQRRLYTEQRWQSGSTCKQKTCKAQRAWLRVRLLKCSYEGQDSVQTQTKASGSSKGLQSDNLPPLLASTDAFRRKLEASWLQTTAASAAADPASGAQQHQLAALWAAVVQAEQRLEASLPSIGATIAFMVGVIILEFGVQGLLDHYLGDSVLGSVACILVGLGIVLWIKLAGLQVSTLWQIDADAE